MRALKYDKATGEVLGDRAADPLPALPASMAYWSVPTDWDGDWRAKYVAAGTLADRKAVALAPATILVGEMVTVGVPAGANWTLDGLFYIGPKAVSFTTPGMHLIVLRGAYSGTSSITVTTLSAVQAALIDKVKTEGERRRMLSMSTGGSKKTVYAAKSAEVENWNSLGGIGALTSTLLAAFNGLSTPVRNRKFRFAIKDAAAHGDSVTNAIARFTAGADASLTEAARIEGIEQAAGDRIRSATTLAAANAAFAGINWNAT